MPKASRLIRRAMLEGEDAEKESSEGDQSMPRIILEPLEEEKQPEIEDLI